MNEFDDSLANDRHNDNPNTKRLCPCQDPPSGVSRKPQTKTDWATVRASASHSRPLTSQTRGDEGVPQRNTDQGVPKGNRKGSGLGD